MLGMIVCWIMVVIKMFQNAGAVHGIIGILCSLYAFIWGWMNAGKLNLRNIMLIWTVLIILYAILAATGAANFSYGVGTPGATTP
jgi:heme A synthase